MNVNQQNNFWKNLPPFLFTLAAVAVCALLIRPFFSAVIGAIVLAVATQRPYDWLSARIRRRSLCAAVALSVVILAVVIPGFFLMEELVRQLSTAIILIKSDTTQQKIIGYIAAHPGVASKLQAFTDSIDPANTARSVATWLAKFLASFFGHSISMITQLVIMLFLLYFLFRDRAMAVGMLRSLLPLREEEKETLILRVRDTIYAASLGRVAVAAVQGVLAWLAYWILGVPVAFLWALMTMLMAIIPAFGAVLVWAPIALYLGFSDSWLKAALLVIWGGLIVSMIDNFLYPILVGSRLKTHTAVMMISLLGGIAVFGISGVVLGPVSFTVAASLLEFWRSRSA